MSTIGTDVAYIGGSAVAATTITIPAGHRAGDLLMIWAFRDGSATNPSIPTGWTNLTNTLDTTSGSASCAWKFALSGSETSGTWTNASHLEVVAFRYTDTVAPVGTIGTSNGTTNTVTYAAAPFKNTGAQSWVIAFASHRSTDTTLETPPSGMTNIINLADATCETVYHRQMNRPTSWPSTNVSITGTASGWVSLTCEIRGQTHNVKNYMFPRSPDTNAGIISMAERIR